MTQQVKKKLVRIDFIEKEQKKFNKQVEREKAQVKMEKFLMRLNKEYKPVKVNLDKMLNVKYLESTVLIHEIKYQQVYRNNGMY